jgi:hypothetical protein
MELVDAVKIFKLALATFLVLIAVAALALMVMMTWSPDELYDMIGWVGRGVLAGVVGGMLYGIMRDLCGRQS